MIAQAVSRFNPYDRLAFYRREATFGSPIEIELAYPDSLGILHEFAVGQIFTLEHISGALIPAGGAPQLNLPPDLLERLARTGSVRTRAAEDAWLLEKWFERRKRYLPELYSAPHRAKSALRRVRAFDRLAEPATADVYKRVSGGTDAVSVLRFPSAGHAP